MDLSLQGDEPSRQDDILQFLEEANFDVHQLPPLDEINDNSNAHDSVLLLPPTNHKRPITAPPTTSAYPLAKKSKAQSDVTVVSSDGSVTCEDASSERTQQSGCEEIGIPTYAEWPTINTIAMLVPMNKEEMALYQSVLKERRQIYASPTFQNKPTKAFVLEQKLTAPLGMNFLTMQWDEIKRSSASKVQCILQDILHQRRTSPGCRIVVFTQYSKLLNTLISVLKHHSVRALAGVHSCPPGDGVVILVNPFARKTFALTNIHMVYFLEPYIDPWIEIKALRRVEPLKFQIKKVVYKDSVEMNVLEWQKETIMGRHSLQDGDIVSREGIQILCRGLI